jgi:hypothetical protein
LVATEAIEAVLADTALRIRGTDASHDPALTLNADLAGLAVRRRTAGRRLRRSPGPGVDASAAVGALEVGGTVGVVLTGELALTACAVAAGRAFLIRRADSFGDASAVTASLVGRAIVVGLACGRVLSVRRVVIGVVGIGAGTTVAGSRVWRRLVGIGFGGRDTGSAPADAVAGAVGVLLAPEGTAAIKAEGIAAAVGVLRAGDPTDIVLAAPAVSALGVVGALPSDDASAGDA